MNKDVVNQLVNKIRVENNLAPLTINSKLEESAQKRSSDLCNSAWSHNGWTNSLTYDYLRAGENLAKNYDTEEQMVNAWVDSKDHYKNILGDYEETGIGITSCDGNTYVVQHFGYPNEYVPTSQTNTATEPLIVVLMILTMVVLAIATLFASIKQS